MANLTRRNFFSRTSTTHKQLLPWIKSSDQFFDQCSRCEKCISVCETNIIFKSDGGFPSVDFSLGECTFCYLCADACPEDLFASQSNAPWTQIAVIDEQCLSKNKVTCRSCEDNCEPMAITFIRAIGAPATPVIDNQLCNGCGACVKPCPSNSIVMNKNPTHEKELDSGN